ncbi:MAG TPA: hypothetical protein VFE88_00830 [Candidatus Nanoarchaeia archaeon]|nr:hypothetical protein [Candidatus Nanoarchaeia archaeon]
MGIEQFFKENDALFIDASALTPHTNHTVRAFVDMHSPAKLYLFQTEFSDTILDLEKIHALQATYRNAYFTQGVQKETQALLTLLAFGYQKHKGQQQVHARVHFTKPRGNTPRATRIENLLLEKRTSESSMPYTPTLDLVEQILETMQNILREIPVYPPPALPANVPQGLSINDVELLESLLAYLQQNQPKRAAIVTKDQPLARSWIPRLDELTKEERLDISQRSKIYLLRNPHSYALH